MSDIDADAELVVFQQLPERRLTAWMTVADAARLLGRSHSLIRKAIRLGQLRSSRRLDVVVVTRASVERYAAERRGLPGRRVKTRAQGSPGR